MNYLYLNGQVTSGLTCPMLRGDLDAVRSANPSAPVTVVVNSEGGDVYEGVAIYNLLRSAHVDIVISGMAASIASVIAMAGQHVAMYANSLLYVHHAWTFGEGNAADLMQQVDQLRAADRILIDAYIAKSGRSESDIVALMDGPTCQGSAIDAARALELGLIDEILDPAQAVAACLKSQRVAAKRDTAAVEDLSSPAQADAACLKKTFFTSSHTSAAESPSASTRNQEHTDMDPETNIPPADPAAECGGSGKPTAEEVVEIEKEVKKEEEKTDAEPDRISELEKKIEELTAALAARDEKLAAQAKFRRVVAAAQSETAEVGRMTFPEAVAKYGFSAACEKFPQLRADYMRAEIRRGSIR